MLSIEEYWTLRERAANAKEYHKAHAHFNRDGSSVLDAEAIAAAPEEARITNEQRSAIEVFEFSAAKPDRYFAYWQPAKTFGEPAHITTWTGEQLATVTWIGPMYRSPAFGSASKRVNFRAVTADGTRYAGTYYTSSGDYVRMRKLKETNHA